MRHLNTARIYSNIKLIERSSLDIPPSYHHYLKIVLRLKLGGQFRIFNEQDGEFLAEITEIIKNKLTVYLSKKLRMFDDESEVILGISLIKSDRLVLAIDSAVQLGVTKIVPIIAERSQYRTINREKFLKSIIESTEQSERLNPPILASVTKLKDFLNQTSGTIICANETENKVNILRNFPEAKPISLLIGPEGGFSENEIKILTKHPSVISVSLAPNILRSETAVSTLLAQILLISNA